MTTSRDSGAGAYSQGIAAPSPSPQLDGELPFARLTLPVREPGRSVSVAIVCIMSLSVVRPGSALRRSSLCV